jgi:glucokinase
MIRPAVIALEWGAALTGAIVLEDGQVLTPQTSLTPQALDAAFDMSHLLIQNLIEQAGAQNLDVVGIGVGAHGQVSTREGILYASPLFKTWRDVPLVETLKDSCHLPVTLANAAQAAALLEYESGAAARASHALYLHIGHTVESAYLVNGAIFQGAQESHGSIGQLTADWRGEKPISLDDVVTIPGIQRLYYSRTRIDERPVYEEIVQLALAGHSLAIKAIRDTARVLGTLLPPVAALMGTSLIIIGGEVPQIGSLWWGAFETAFYASRPPLAAHITLRQAHYGSYSVLYSMGRLALRHFLPER